MFNKNKAMMNWMNSGRQRSSSFRQRMLHEAIKSEDYLKVEELLTSAAVTPGLDVSKDQCALELAVSTGNASIVQLLVQSGCCVSGASSAGGGGGGVAGGEVSHEVQFRALDVAIYRRFNDIVEILLKAGFDITLRYRFQDVTTTVRIKGEKSKRLSTPIRILKKKSY